MELLINQEKIKAIHDFMNELENKRSNKSKTEIYREYESYLLEVSPIDIFYIPWYQNDTDKSIEEIKDTAGKFVNVFYHGLEKNAPSSYDSELLNWFLKESKAIEAHLDKIKPFFKKGELLKHKNQVIKELQLCTEFDKKYQKKEMVLFPALEKYLPTTKPMEVLWSLHDDARDTLKSLLKLLSKVDINEMDAFYLIGEYYSLVYGINNKEELILLPVADQMLRKEEKDKLFKECLEYGYVFIDELPKIADKKKTADISSGYIKTETGHLDINQFLGLMKYIPIDITFVDKNDKVTFFNDRKQRHFPRNPSIIGRLVKHCHPPKSVHIVEDIMDAFKKGEKEIAEFWIKFKDAFLYITYYAVLNENKEYIGTLEVSQDVTRIRELSGEQRLLDWK